MGGIEPLIVLPVAALHFPVVPWGIRTDKLMGDPMLFQVLLEQGGFLPVSGETVCEFRPVIRLDTFNTAGKSFHKVFQEHSSRVGVMLFKSLHKTPAGILVNGSILKEFFANDLRVFEAGEGNEFYVNLDALPGMIHLLIRLWNIFGIRRMDSHDTLPSEEAVEASDGAGIATLHEFYPENDEAGIRISPTHIGDESDLFRGMLAGMMVGAPGEASQGFDRAVKAAFPAVDVLPVGFVFNGSVGDTIFFSISEER